MTILYLYLYKGSHLELMFIKKVIKLNVKYF